MAVIGNVQLGKSGITENFIESLRNLFKNHENIKIHVLQNSRRTGKEGKEDVQKYADEILEKLGKKYTSKNIGFVISLKKWRKEVRE
jgi:RNA-binding protein YhbY